MKYGLNLHSRLGFAAVVSVMLCGAALGQSAAAYSFEVVSIKPADPNFAGMRVMNDAGKYSATNITLKGMVAGAYGIRMDLISGMSAWAEADHYDVEARADEATVDAIKKLPQPERTAAQRQMMQKFLQDRFGLKAHTETRDLPVYELVIARSGFKLKDVSTSDVPATATNGANPMLRKGMMMMNGGTLTAQSIGIAQLAANLQGQVQRNVIDKTGLTGKYDIQLKWAPDQMRNAGTAGEDAGPSLFTALEEQLGLKLVSSKGPVETVVVDKADKPTGN